QAEVAGLFTVITREYAKTARVDGQCLVQTKLRRKIGDDTIAWCWKGTREPRFLLGWMHIGIEVAENRVIALQVIGLVSNCFEALRLHLAQKAYRIMSNFFPQSGIKCTIECTCLGMPAPPQIIGKFVQSIDARGHSREDRHAAINFHRVSILSYVSLCPVYLLRNMRSNLATGPDCLCSEIGL